MRALVWACVRACVCLGGGLSQTDTSGYSEGWNYFKTLTGCQRSLRLLPSSLKKSNFKWLKLLVVRSQSHTVDRYSRVLSLRDQHRYSPWQNPPTGLLPHWMAEEWRREVEGFGGGREKGSHEEVSPCSEVKPRGRGREGWLRPFNYGRGFTANQRAVPERGG